MWADTLAQTHELPCAMDVDPETRAQMKCDGKCSDRGGRFFGLDFDGCPVGAARRDVHIATVCELEQLSSLGLLNGSVAEGDTYVAWVPSLWAELRHERAIKARQEAQR